MLNISHNGQIVHVEGTISETEDYDVALNSAHHALWHFKACQRNKWGCDGIGYVIEKAKGHIRLNLSTVGPRNYSKGLTDLKACNLCQSISAV